LTMISANIICIHMKSERPLPTRYSSPGMSAGFLLWKISNAWQRRQRAALKPFELTHSQFVLLATTTWFGATETLTQARLSELSGVDAMTTSQIVRVLETAGLVRRREHPDDPRAMAIGVTPAGRARAAKALEAVEQTDEDFFEPLRAQSAAFLKLLRVLAGSTDQPSDEP
jgi:MarR family transcriptional regulator, organic hydroperoxide resistance regulator